MDQFAGLSRINVNGTELAFQTQGEGDPVVLVHGGVSDLRTWSQLVPALSPHWKAIAYSRRYARPNEDIPDGVDDPIQSHVDDLAEFLRQTHSTPAHLIGHSWGGLIVLMTAMQYPELVKSLVMIEPPALTLFVRFPLRPGQIISALIKSPAATFSILKLGGTVMDRSAKQFRNGNDKAAIEIFGRGVLGSSRFDRLSPERYQQVWDNRGAEKALALGQGFPPLDDKQLTAVKVPSLLLAGTDSPAAFHRVAAKLAELLPGARLETIQDASHIVHEDAPDSTNAAIIGFLNAQ